MDVILNLKKNANLGLKSKPKASEKKIPCPKVDFLEFHNSLGHPNFAITRETAKAHGINLEGPADAPCAPCAISKAQKKPISKKETIPKASLPVQHLFIDISGTKYNSIGGNMFWLLVLDDAMNNAFSYFLKEKSKTSEVMIPFLKSLHAHFGHGVQ